MRRSITALGVMAGVALPLVGCSNGPPVEAGSPAVSGDAAAPVSTVSGLTPAAVVRETDELTFVPAAATVKVGDVVEWMNNGTTPHNVTFDNGPHSSTMNGGDTYEARFSTPGTYRYRCTFHAPAMAGTVVVTG